MLRGFLTIFWVDQHRRQIGDPMSGKMERPFLISYRKPGTPHCRHPTTR
jgi:hypothetical protein